MLFYDCEMGYVPDDGQNDVKDGSVENYPLDWDSPVPADAPACPCACPDAGACTPDDAKPGGQ